MDRIVKYMGKDPNSPITLRAMLDPKYAFRIIGAQGNVHQYIQTTHSVRLYLHNDRDRYGRICSIAGPVTNVARAWREVICIIFNKSMQSIPRIWLKLLIPSELAIKLQDVPSKNYPGCILNEISNVTNTRITISPDPIANTTEHYLEVSKSVGGTFLDDFTKALTMIGRQFQIYRHEALSPKNIYYTPFCYNRPPLLEDEDEDESDDEYDDYYDPRVNSDVKNGKRPQQHVQQENGISRSKDKGKSILDTIPEYSTLASAASSSPSLSSSSSSIFQHHYHHLRKSSPSTSASTSSSAAESSSIDHQLSSISPLALIQQQHITTQL